MTITQYTKCDAEGVPLLVQEISIVAYGVEVVYFDGARLFIYGHQIRDRMPEGISPELRKDFFFEKAIQVAEEEWRAL